MSISYCGYRRVSTSRQGVSGLSLDHQAESIKRFVAGKGANLVAEFTEVETATGKRDRPELAKAIELCKRHGYTLLIAEFSRLSRSVYFTASLQRSGVQFVAIDNEFATPFVINILSAVAEQEAISISKRVRDALRQAKARGTQLGSPSIKETQKLGSAGNQMSADTYADKLLPVIDEIRTKGKVTSLRGIASALNARGLTSRTGRPFKAQTIANILGRSTPTGDAQNLAQAA